MTLPAVSDLAGIIDHAVLRPELTRADLDADIEFAARARVYSVTVRPFDVAHTAGRLAGTGVRVSAAIGFPHGTSTTAVKVYESQLAVADGATEIAVLINTGMLRSGALADVESEIRAITMALPGVPVKAVLETTLINPIQVELACRAAERAGASTVVAGTGFSGSKDDPDTLRIMRAVTTSSVQVKANAGVASLDELMSLLELGVTQIGTDETRRILDELERQHAMSAPVGGVALTRGRHSY